MEIESKYPDQYSHHGWMIKITPLKMLSVSLVIYFIIPQFKQSRYNDAQQGTQYDQYPDFFIEIQRW